MQEILKRKGSIQIQRYCIQTIKKRGHILKQEKGRGVVLMDRHKYTDKCLALLSAKQFTTLTNNLTKTMESKVPQTLRKRDEHFQNQSIKSYTQQDHVLRNSMVMPKFITYQ